MKDIISFLKSINALLLCTCILTYFGEDTFPGDMFRNMKYGQKIVFLVFRQWCLVCLVILQKNLSMRVPLRSVSLVGIVILGISPFVTMV